jgi:hypothetical protein
MQKWKPSPAMTVASIALLAALCGTAVASSRYLITSASQIKPSVLAELTHVRASSTPKAAKAIVARIRSSALFTTATENAAVSLSSATWTQQAAEVQQLVGQMTVSPPSPYTCPEPLSLVVKLDGAPVLNAQNELWSEPKTYPLLWNRKQPYIGPTGELSNGFESFLLYEPGVATSHTLTVEASDHCPPEGGHFTINYVSIDVLGAR